MQIFCFEYIKKKSSYTKIILYVAADIIASEEKKDINHHVNKFRQRAHVDARFVKNCVVSKNIAIKNHSFKIKLKFMVENVMWK